MSAPVSHDPLVVNTKDGTVWQRRAVTRDGRGLYAVTDAPACCPEFVMATLAELAEHGIAGSADALPVPVGPERPALSGERLAEIRSLDLLSMMDDRQAPVVSRALADLLAEVERMRVRITELEAVPTFVYRAEHPDSGIVLGTYSNREAAAAHCEALARREGSTGLVSWVPDDGDALSPEELTFFDVEYCDGDDVPVQTCTGYVVTPLKVAAEYDAGADE
ncbi:hypothetical protein ACH4UY_04660 [Streptomyces longwoodensis]|uniref:hypothetical protein n=1 Tax=Streptomyces longwoodensis TaxID=68231 RepID=UPI00379FB7F9